MAGMFSKSSRGMFGPTPKPRTPVTRATPRPSPVKNYSTQPRGTKPVGSSMNTVKSNVPAAATPGPVAKRMADFRQSALQRQTMQKASMSRFAGTNAARNMSQVQSRVAAAKAARQARGK